MHTTIRYLFILALLLAGCTGKENTGSDPQPLPGNAITLWTETTELFMEYPALVAGAESRFAAHLTWMDNFTPMTEGTATLIFQGQSGEEVRARADGPTSPGIYRPTATFTAPGTYSATMLIEGRLRDTLRLGNVTVFAGREAALQAPEADEPEGGISYLKEQQWKVEFQTRPAVRRPMSGSVRASGEIVPKLKSEVIVAAPFTGTIALEQNAQMPVVGAELGAGTVLATLTPSAETAGGEENFASRYVDAESERSLAEKELERVKRLYEIQAVSEKELDEARAAFRRADAMLKTLGTSARPGAGQGDAETRPDGGYTFTLRSPIAGTVVEAFVVPGKQFQAGEPLFRIINMATVWVKAGVPVADIGKLTDPRRASFRIPGFEETFEINEKNGKRISMGSAVEEKTRTIPVVFEVANPGMKMRIGMYAQVFITAGRESDVLAVPESAIIEEEGTYSVYVHVSGESFVKRAIDVGVRDRGYVEIKGGVAEGERIVTRGAHHVRLASLATQLPAHGHEH